VGARGPTPAAPPRAARPTAAAAGARRAGACVREALRQGRAFPGRAAKGRPGWAAPRSPAAGSWRTRAAGARLARHSSARQSGARGARRCSPRLAASGAGASRGGTEGSWAPRSNTESAPVVRPARGRGFRLPARSLRSVLHGRIRGRRRVGSIGTGAEPYGRRGLRALTMIARALTGRPPARPRRMLRAPPRGQSPRLRPASVPAQPQGRKACCHMGKRGNGGAWGARNNGRGSTRHHGARTGVGTVSQTAAGCARARPGRRAPARSRRGRCA
jgi:hypothetical protein